MTLSVIDCQLTRLDDGQWWCEVCDPDRQALLPESGRQNCGTMSAIDVAVGAKVKHSLKEALAQPTCAVGLVGESTKFRQLIKEVASDTPGLSRKMIHYGRAVYKWIKAGCPVRDQEERERLHGICKACPDNKFDHEASACTVCGCKVTAKGIPVRDMAAMATETCPRGHWKYNHEYRIGETARDAANKTRRNRSGRYLREGRGRHGCAHG